MNGLRSRANNFTVDASDNNDEDIGVRRQGFFTLVPQPIEDEANVDERRKELGMPPLADYLKMANDRPGAPAKQPDGKASPPKKD